jgi:hypothetical protein
LNIARVSRSLARIAIATTIAAALLFGAAAVLARQPSFAQVEYLGVARADPAELRRHVWFLTSDVRPRDAFHTQNLDAAAAYIAAAFTSAGGEVRELVFEARGRTYRNVTATFGGEEKGRPLLIVGAHYDAFGATGNLPGADDNASGTAGLLELARLLGQQRPVEPVMLVAFTNEEPPFFGSDQMGSAVHAESLVHEHRHVAGMICLEMIGYFSEQQRWGSWVLSLLYPHRGNFIGVGGGWPDRHLARAVKNGIRGAGGVRALSFTGPRETLDASDQRSYWAAGWTAVMVTDTAYLRNPNYHAAGDTADTLDYTAMAHVIDGIFNAVLQLRSG